MVENLKDLKILFLIADKIFNIYTLIKEKMYDDEKYDEEVEQLKILLKLEKDELNKLELDYYYLEDLKERILNDEENRYFDSWAIEDIMLINQLSSHQFNSIDGKKMFHYKEEDKREFVALRVYQNLNLLQTKCLNYPFDSLFDIINNEEFTVSNNNKFYIEDIEKVTGIYTHKNYGKIDCFKYSKKALKRDHILVLDARLREKLYLEIKADYFLNSYCICNIDKDNNSEIKNFYIDNMINMLYIIPLLEERLVNNNFSLEEIKKYLSSNIYKNQNNLKFLDMIRTREFISNCNYYLEAYINYDNYNIRNYYSSYKDDNIISEFASIMILISNIKACFDNKTRHDLLHSIKKVLITKRKRDNKELLKILKENIIKRKVKTFTLK